MQQDPHRGGAQTALYLTPEHPCAYLPERPSQTLFVDPACRPDPTFYEYLLAVGFRRSGNHVYRPHCPGCRACVPVRIPVQGFQPRRSQRRCLKRSAERLEVVARPAEFDGEHFALYRRYTARRHPEGGMADADETAYLEFLRTLWCETLFVELRLDDRLLAVAVTDRLPHALSAVYTFFDPDLHDHSPGVLAILWQIEQARQWDLAHLYLGYWIEDCDKMRYKGEYRPLEAWDGQVWRRFGAGQPLHLTR